MQSDDAERYPLVTKYGLTEKFINTVPQNYSGVYAICKGRKFIYIGEDDDIRSRLLEFLHGRNECVARMDPDTFSIEPASGELRTRLLARCLLRYDPPCNREQRSAQPH